MSGFIGKILGWIASEAFVSMLANNKTFQRFAVTTDAALNNNLKRVTSLSQEIARKAVEKANTAAKNGGQAIDWQKLMKK